MNCVEIFLKSSSIFEFNFFIDKCYFSLDSFFSFLLIAGNEREKHFLLCSEEEIFLKIELLLAEIGGIIKGSLFHESR